jgi:TPR repeat protein
MGLLYDEGRIYKQNKIVAVKWYKAAAKQGHQKATERLDQLQTELIINNSTQPQSTSAALQAIYRKSINNLTKPQSTTKSGGGGCKGCFFIAFWIILGLIIIGSLANSY